MAWPGMIEMYSCLMNYVLFPVSDRFQKERENAYSHLNSPLNLSDMVNNSRMMSSTSLILYLSGTDIERCTVNPATLLAQRSPTISSSHYRCFATKTSAIN